MQRILIGGLVGGVVIFIWGAMYHLATPLGMMGLSPLPDEATVVSAVKSSVREKGLYFFPGIDMSKAPSAEEMKARDEKAKAGPVGLLIVNPTGGEPMSPGQLGTELASNVLAALIAAALLSRVVGSYFSRVFFLVFVGILGWVSISLSYWNWYGFPMAFTVAAGLEEAIAWLLAGLVIAWIVPAPRAGTTEAAS